MNAETMNNSTEEIYVVEKRVGRYEDCSKRILFVGSNKNKAFEIVEETIESNDYEIVYISLYTNGYITSELEYYGTKWSWNYGKDKMEYPANWNFHITHNFFL